MAIKDAQFSARIPSETIEKLDRAAAKTGVSRNDLVSTLLAQGLERIWTGEINEGDIRVPYRIIGQINYSGVIERNEMEPAVQSVVAEYKGAEANFVHVTAKYCNDERWLMLDMDDIFDMDPIEWAKILDMEPAERAERLRFLKMCRPAPLDGED
jgi:metal-responsive CopG/Arc/MetJ family transcriptional regulator